MKVGIQTGGQTIPKFGAEKSYEMFRKAGFETVGWDIINDGSIHQKYDQKVSDIERAKQYELDLIKANGFHIDQVHLYSYLPFTDPENVRLTHQHYGEVLRYCQKVGVKYAVFHGIDRYETDAWSEFDKIHDLNMQLYAGFIPVLKECPDVTVCMENLATSFQGMISDGANADDPYEANDYIDTLNQMAGRDDAFGLCLDTGHLQLIRRDFAKYIRVLGKRIKCLHLHDNMGDWEDMHLAPFTGGINWQAVCDTLGEVGYDGNLVFETFRQTDRALVFGEEMLMAWMETLYACGDAFRRRILSSKK